MATIERLIEQAEKELTIRFDEIEANEEARTRQLLDSSGSATGILRRRRGTDTTISDGIRWRGSMRTCFIPKPR